MALRPSRRSNPHARPFRRILLPAAAFVLAMLAARATAADTIKLYKPGHYAVSRLYQLELLAAALKRSEAEFGPYNEQPYTETISVARGLIEAVHGNLINVILSDVGQDEFNHDMLAIPIALDKGRHGYRVAFIRKDQQEKLREIRTIADLRALTIGQGAGWGDIRIYEYNGFNVVTGPNHDALRLMLVRERFDIFPRSVLEAQNEYASFRERHPELTIDEHLLIRYPFSQHFYVARSAPRVAERLRSGFKALVEDGTFDQAFDRHYGNRLRALALERRVVIELENPFLPAWAPRLP
jgi:hypothetical protein